MAVYEFDARAPTYEEIAAKMSEIENRALNMSTLDASKLFDGPRAVTSAPCDTPHFIPFSNISARIDDSGRWIKMSYSISGDKLCLSGNSELLFQSACKAFEMLGGTRK